MTDESTSSQSARKRSSSNKPNPPQALSGGGTNALPPNTVMECGAAISTSQMAQFVQSFQQSTRRWEFIVYPALFAFVVLAGYGFFLIYSLTGNMTIIARAIDPDMGIHMKGMTRNIGELSHQVEIMTTTMHEISSKLNTLEPMLQEMNQISQDMDSMKNNLVNMDASVANMHQSIGNMDQSLRAITATTDTMRTDMGQMSHTYGRPMSFFNNYMPW